MREFLRRRQMEESGVTGVNIWAESHAAIHTWDEDNYFAFDAVSCKDFQPKDALRLLLTYFDIETLNCVNVFRHQRSIPRVSNFQVNAQWEVIVGGKVVGELDSVDFNEISLGARAPEPRALSGPESGPDGPGRPRDWKPAPAAARDGNREKKRSASGPARPRRRTQPRPA
jgi:hypothetical protein